MDYEAAVADYKAQRLAYKTSSKAAKSTTLDNTEANNALYKTMMAMFADAKAIFRKEPALRDQFAFTNVLDQVVSASVAGIRGRVTVAGDKKGIEKVLIVIEGKDKVIETNDLGRYDVPQLAAGEYTLKFVCKGFKDVVVEGFEVKTGVYNTLNVEMV